jgi:hypothetical protein
MFARSLRTCTIAHNMLPLPGSRRFRRARQNPLRAFRA